MSADTPADVLEVKVVGADTEWQLVVTGRITGSRNVIDGFTSHEAAMRAALDLEELLVDSGATVLGSAH
ncbi:MAG: hypothetical protein ACK4TP_10165 [Hyphomicrobium sp.]